MGNGSGAIIGGGEWSDIFLGSTGQLNLTQYVAETRSSR